MVQKLWLPELRCQVAAIFGWATPSLDQVIQTVCPASAGDVDALMVTMSPAIGSRGARSVAWVE